MAEDKGFDRPATALLCTVLCALAGGYGCSTEAEDTGQSGQRARSEVRSAAETETIATGGVLEDDAVGYSLSYPRTWEIAGQVVATEFAANADCRSVQIIDREPPPDAGPGAQVLSSLVQVCSRRLDDGTPLEEFLRKTYDDELFARFRRTTAGGVTAFTTGTAVNSITFLQTDAHRLQVVTAAVADPKDRHQRIAEVEAVLESLSVGR